MRSLALLVSLLATGCSTAPPRHESLFADALFGPPAEEIRADGIFALSDRMRAFAHEKIQPRIGENGISRAIFKPVRDEIFVDYDVNKTRPAAETFELRAGNCLSATIMLAAFAKELGIPVRYQRAATQGVWSRQDNLAFYSGHVNLVLGLNAIGIALEPRPGRIIDITPAEVTGPQAGRFIPEELLLAMYLNNRAAEAMLDGDLDSAYAWAREAVRAAPTHVSSYNTLGVIYRRHGNLAEAERVLRYALEREPDNVNLLSNLVAVLENQLRFATAAEVAERLRAIAPYPPFYFLEAGLAAAERGDLESAVDLYEKELRRMPYDDEVHYALAQAEFRRGRVGNARLHVDAAMRNSVTRERRALYSAKLSKLQAMN